MLFSKLVSNSFFLSNPTFRKAISKAIGNPTWLVKAMLLKAYKSDDRRLQQLVDEIYIEVTQHIKVQTPAKTKEAIKTILINLWIGAFFNRPIRYSRNKNSYKSARRYGRLFMKYDRLIPVIDTLKYFGYIQQQPHIYIFDKKFGYQTRMWATESLLQRFEEAGLCTFDFFTLDSSKDPIILKDSQKLKIGYVDDRKTINWRTQLEQYNHHIDNSKITVVFNSEVPLTIRFLIQFLYQYVIKGAVRINSVNLKHQYQIPYHNQYYPNTNTIQYHYTVSTMTQKKRWNPLPIVPIPESKRVRVLHNYLTDLMAIIRGFDNFDHATAFLNQTIFLKDLGIEHLEFQLVYEHLYRVFNDGSFSRGGRFYGPLHQSLSSDIRRFIYIDGQPTVELDYSAFHIKMLYHMAGIDYSNDPYSTCEGTDFRKVYKAVALIAINAENDRKAYSAITNELKERGLTAPDRERHIASLVDIFKQTHLPIQRHLFSGVGTKLQNIDSDIMNNILTLLLEMGIVGLPVHDSVIVQAQHREILESLMIEEYQKRMGFRPVVDIK